MAKSRRLLTEVILGTGTDPAAGVPEPSPTPSAAVDATHTPHGAGRTELAALTDTHLVVAIAHRQVDALAEVYERYGSAVRQLAGRLCSPATADAVTREVFLGVWDEAPTDQVASGSLLGALLSSAHRRSVTVLRAEADRRPREYSMSAADLEQAVMGPWISDELAALLAVLSEDQRMAIVLAYFGGFSAAQVAELLCISERLVATEVTDGLERLGGRPPPSGVPGRPSDPE
jgi:RNA polymerase sigma-70 factor (ECF subfamily)